MEIFTLKKHALTFAMVAFGTCSSMAQLAFTNSNAKLPGNGVNYRSGNCVTVVDVNNDGLDDIIRLNQSNEVNYTIQNSNGTFTNYLIGTMGGGQAWGMSVADFDHNGIKDVVGGFGSSGYVAMVSLSGGNYTGVISQLAQSNFFWQNISIVDMNNDGWEDIFGCDDVNFSKLYINNQNGTFRRLATSIQSHTIATGSISLTTQTGLSFNIGDQVYITFSGENYMKGDVVSYSSANGAITVNVTSTAGSGTFGAWSIDKNTVINFITHPGNFGTTGDPNNSGNYGTVWTDFDSDGDVDFYIAKCRQSSSDPNDTRRIDELFINDGSYKFTENAAARGLAIGWQTWTASFGDIDNDGDYDEVAVNNDFHTQMMENTGGGNFTEIVSSQFNTSSIYPMESIFEDFDNDGFVDLLVTGDDNWLYYHNNGDKTFTQINGLLSTNGVMSFATGDLNHDGWIDIYASLGDIYNNPSNTFDDILYLNNGGGNHFITFDLQGTVSNIGALGANVLIYGPWGVQMREVRAGESYGTCNTSLLHFGLGTHQTVDSVTIKWPSGIVQHFYGLPADQFVSVTENVCSITNNVIAGAHAICPGQSTTLSAPSGFTSYLWSNGDINSSISVSNTGAYSVLVTDANGCTNLSATINMQVSPDETPTIAINGNLTFCEGGSVDLTSSNAASYTWSNGQTGQTINVTQSGTYTVNIAGSCQSWASAPVVVTAINTPDAVVSPASIPSGSTATLTATGDNLRWFDAASGGNLLATGNTYTTPALFVPTTYYVQSQSFYGVDSAQVGKTTQTATGSAFSGNAELNYGLMFDVLAPCVINQFTVYTDTVFGIRKVLVRDAVTNAIVSSANIDVTNATSIVSVNISLQPGSYYITCDSLQNELLWGHAGPRLKRSNTGTTFPYTYSSVLSITSSDQGNSYYYYFYDWKVSKQPTVCDGNVIPVLVDITTGISHLNNSNGVEIYPNPACDMLFIKSMKDIKGSVQVSFTDVAGRLVQQNSYQALTVGNSQTIPVHQLAKGVYFVKVNTLQSEIIQKVIIK